MPYVIHNTDDDSQLIIKRNIRNGHKIEIEKNTIEISAEITKIKNKLKKYSEVQIDLITSPPNGLLD